MKGAYLLTASVRGHRALRDDGGGLLSDVEVECIARGA